MSTSTGKPTFHAAMFPFLAMGHLTPFLHLSNKLAEKGNKISYICPPKTISKLESMNLYPNLITFVPLGLPHIDGLPHGAETFSDVSPSLAHLLMLAFFDSRKHVESILIDLRPDFVFFDHAHWVPSFARQVGIKSVAFITSGAASTAYIIVPSRNIQNDDDKTRLSLMEPPPDFPPDSSLKLHAHEVEDAIPFWADKNEDSGGLTTHQLVIILSKDQFQELILGIERTGLPFLAALKPPAGFETVDEALPDGFKERVGGRGLVHGGWVQQPKILAHRSVRCFVSHCGFGSLSESLLNDVQLVLMPQLDDQYLTSRLLSGELKVAVEVERKRNESWFSKESICSAIKMVMDEDSKAGFEIKANHLSLKGLLSKQGVESSYIDNFISKLQEEINK
ncbi:UDP-glycosyltransferase 79B30-like [Papaver somniferum]|uniref:UDP-glycosyltransferase 79B30-like n=1 Tax=Papaver somniferum TaxID=3469 RepID=UPI000E6F6359|nr:UDP-glycosyltransferase 79B30-like [Papaver somniferum]